MFTLTGHTDWINCLAFAPGGRFLAAGDHAGWLGVWDLQRRRKRQFFHVPGVREGRLAREGGSASCSAGGKLLVTATGTFPPYVRVWKAGTLEMVHQWEGTFTTSAAVFLPDGQTVVS